MKHHLENSSKDFLLPIFFTAMDQKLPIFNTLAGHLCDL